MPCRHMLGVVARWCGVVIPPTEWCPTLPLKSLYILLLRLHRQQLRDYCFTGEGASTTAVGCSYGPSVHACCPVTATGE
jgi:hypothetical protein